jgi:hypothetical protein
MPLPGKATERHGLGHILVPVQQSENIVYVPGACGPKKRIQTELLMKNTIKNSWMSLVIVTLVATGCATTTHITGESGLAESPNFGSYRKVLLAATLQNNDARVEMENAFQSVLATQGVDGVVSYTAIPAPADASKAQLVEVLQNAGADAVLVIMVVKRETETKVTTFNSSAFNSDHYTQYNAGAISSDPLVYEYEIVDLEAKLFDAATEKMVWSIRTESIDPKKLQQDIHDYAKLISDRLVAVGMVGTNATPVAP